jgi:hypothetical protein
VILGTDVLPAGEADSAGEMTVSEESGTSFAINFDGDGDLKDEAEVAIGAAPNHLSVEHH